MDLTVLYVIKIYEKRSTLKGGKACSRGFYCEKLEVSLDKIKTKKRDGGDDFYDAFSTRRSHEYLDLCGVHGLFVRVQLFFSGVACFCLIKK